jgi:hypothetical protein
MLLHVYRYATPNTELNHSLVLTEQVQVRHNVPTEITMPLKHVSLPDQRGKCLAYKLRIRPSFVSCKVNCPLASSSFNGTRERKVLKYFV